MSEATRPGVSQLGELELNFAGFHEEYVSRYIHLADAKAGTVLVIVSATLSYLLGLDKFVHALSMNTDWEASTLAIFTSAFLATSGTASFAVIAPRGSPLGRSLVYWCDVAGRTVEDFIEDVRSAGLDGLARERLTHSHTISLICRRKYSVLRVAMWLGAIGLVGALACRLII